jgi:hypothetical protein
MAVFYIAIPKQLLNRADAFAFHGQIGSTPQPVASVAESLRMMKFVILR